MAVLDARKHKAAKLLAARHSQADTARQLGINRSTVMRWQKEPEFQGLVEMYQPDESVQAEQGLSMLVSDAIKLLGEALKGGNISAASARVALDVIRTATSTSKEEVGESSLEARIAQLDARNTGRSD